MSLEDGSRQIETIQLEEHKAGTCGRPREVEIPISKTAEAFAVPTNQGVGSDGDQGVSPIKPAGESGESESDRIGRPSWFDFSFDKKAQLFSAPTAVVGFKQIRVNAPMSRRTAKMIQLRCSTIP
jgi:hypothetical protein